MRLEGKMIVEIDYKNETTKYGESNESNIKGSKPEREINVRQNWYLGHIGPYTNDLHKFIGRSDIYIVDVTILVAQYAKMHHIKSKGVMVTS